MSKRRHDSPLPTGIVSFLFTDIEGSTAAWDRDQDAMANALRRHDEIVRSTFETNRGYVFKTVGDAFCAAFDDVQDAARAAIETQRRLADETWGEIRELRVRMAIHVGVAEHRDGDYFGGTLNRVARLLAIGHGGQILVSSSAAELAKATGTYDLVDLGEHRLKDLSRAEHVWQLQVPGLAREFPPLHSLDAPLNNLPFEYTSFVGREQELRTLSFLIDAYRVVTVVGAGGIGKTRLALHAAADSSDDFSGGVWFADLAQIRDPDALGTQMAEALGVRVSSGSSALEAIISQQSTRSQLLILDNAEHLIEVVADAISYLLRKSSGLHFLITSREPLDLVGEAVMRVKPLDLPPATGLISASAERQYSGVGLFSQRAKSADPSFELTDQNIMDVVNVCRQLDGIPLALELAAARVPTFGVHDLANGLAGKLAELTGAKRGAEPHQTTLRATIDWSYSLISGREQKAFRFLSVFPAGFTANAAAELLASVTGAPQAWLETVGALVEKSLIESRGEVEGSRRYRYLDTIREYASQRLAETGEADVAMRALVEWAGAFVRTVTIGWEGSDSIRWDAVAELELDNVQAALAWSLRDKHDIEAGQRLTSAGRRLWSRLAPFAGRDWLSLARDRISDDTPADVTAGLELGQALVSSALWEHEQALSHAHRAAQICAALGETKMMLEAQRCEAISLIWRANLDGAEDLLNRALASARSMSERGLEASLLNELAWASSLRAGRIADAEHFYRQALSLFKYLGDVSSAAAISSNLAELEYQSGRTHEALVFAQEAMAMEPEGRFAPARLANLATYLVALERWDEARSALQRCLRLTLRFSIGLEELCASQHFAAMLALPGNVSDSDLQNAARIIGFVNARLAEVGDARGVTERSELERVTARLGDRIPAQLRALTEEGASWEVTRGRQLVRALLEESPHAAPASTVGS